MKLFTLVTVAAMSVLFVSCHKEKNENFVFKNEYISLKSDGTLKAKLLNNSDVKYVAYTNENDENLIISEAILVKSDGTFETKLPIPIASLQLIKKAYLFVDPDSVSLSNENVKFDLVTFIGLRNEDINSAFGFLGCNNNYDFTIIYVDNGVTITKNNDKNWKLALTKGWNIVIDDKTILPKDFQLYFYSWKK
jgi:hypothetical protein